MTSSPEQRFAAIYRQEVRYVHRSLWRLGVPERDLEDVTHDVFVVVHRKLDDFDARRPLRPWLFGICFRVALDRRRKHAVSKELFTDAGTADAVAADDVHDVVAEHLERREQRALLETALARLPLEQRAIFVLVELEEVPVTACVDIVGAPLNTLYSRLRLGRQAFSRALAALQASTPSQSAPPGARHPSEAP